MVGIYRAENPILPVIVDELNKTSNGRNWWQNNAMTHNIGLNGNSDKSNDTYWICKHRILIVSKLN